MPVPKCPIMGNGTVGACPKVSHFEENRVKKRVNPLPPEQTKWFLENPQKFNIDKLEANEMSQGFGSQPIVKIPQDRDRIRRTVDEHNQGSIELVIGQGTDPETGEIREETVRIGTSISGHLPGMMIASEVYHDYYDIYGNLRHDTLKETESVTDERREAAREEEANEPESQNETNGTCPQVSHRLRERVAEELEEKNEIQLGGTTLVRLPKIPGIRILPPNQKGLSLVEYKHDQWYDPIKGQSRNRKTIIGQVSDEYPDAMVPNKRYYQLFNIQTGLTWQEEQKRDGIDIEKAVQELRKNVEERKKKEEEERLRREEDERLKSLYGEDSSEMQEAASRRLGKMFSELHDRYDEEDRQDYIDLGVEDEYGTDDNSTGSEDEENDMENQSSDMEDPMSKENSNDESKNGDSNEENKGSGNDGRKDDGKEDIQTLYDQVSKEKERTAILMRILESVAKTISNQAKKHPDHIINVYKARKINEILIELRVKYQGSGYEDLLEMIQEPEEVEQDGQKYLTGMTYSDAEVLLSHYATIIEHIPLRNS